MTLAEQYILKIYEVKSFSAAAKNLFVSQPALSTTVARHEKELGFRIFDRSSTPLNLTPEGRIYIDALEEISETERIMKRRLERLGTPSKHTVSVGGDCYAAQHLLPIICGEHARRFPDARLSIDMNISPKPNYDKLSARGLDFIMCYAFDPKRFSPIALFEERRIIAMHRSLAGAEALAPLAVSRKQLLTHSYPEEKLLRDLTVFAHIPFLPSRADTTLTSFIPSFLSSVPDATHTVFNSHSLSCNYFMLCEGLGAGITTESIIATTPDPGEDVLYFVPATSSACVPLSLIYPKDTPLTPSAAMFAKTATELCENGRILARYA